MRGQYALAGLLRIWLSLEEAVTTRNYDDWTIDRWRIEPQFPSLEIEDPPAPDQAPPLWKDLTLASLIAAGLWAIAAAILR